MDATIGAVIPTDVSDFFLVFFVSLLGAWPLGMADLPQSGQISQSQVSHTDEV